MGEDEEIAKILLNMRVGDPRTELHSHVVGRADTKSKKQQSNRLPSQAGKRYSTRTAAGLKVGRSYANLDD